LIKQPKEGAHESISSLLTFLTLNAFVTTAFLCGDPETVDANENLASVNLIFEHPDNEIIEVLRVSFKDKDATVTKVKTTESGYKIETKSPKARLEIKRSDVSYCDSEELFSLKLNAKTLKDCRCFEG
jgi:hypothetical protein